jgi:hypothetical protein
MASAAELGFTGTVGADIGRDRDGIYRNITREFRVPDVLAKGDYSHLSFHDIVRDALAAHVPESVKSRANIIDTVLFDSGTVEAYVYTDVEGHISRKPKAMLAMTRIQQQFIDAMELFQPRGAKYVALAQFEGREDVQPLTLDDFNTICKTIPANLQTLQIYISSKGDADRYKTYVTHYTLDRTARSNMKTDKL